MSFDDNSIWATHVIAGAFNIFEIEIVQVSPIVLAIDFTVETEEQSEEFISALCKYFDSQFDDGVSYTSIQHSTGEVQLTIRVD